MIARVVKQAELLPWQSSRSRRESRLFFLKEKRGEALACFEQALLHADCDPKEEDIEILYGTPICERGYALIITSTYSTAAEILKRRHLSLCDAYLKAVFDLQLEEKPRQNADTIYETGEHLWETFWDLLDFADQKVPEHGPDKVSIDDLCWDWKGMNNICHLFMDDIIRLNESVDRFNATDKTLASLRLTVLSIAIGAVLAILGPFSSLILAQASNHKPGVHHPGMLYHK